MKRNAIEESATKRANRYPHAHVFNCIIAWSVSQRVYSEAEKEDEQSDRKREKRKLIDLTDENEGEGEGKGEGEGEIAKVARAHTSRKRKGAMKVIYILAFRPSQWHSCGRSGD